VLNIFSIWRNSSAFVAIPLICAKMALIMAAFFVLSLVNESTAEKRLSKFEILSLFNKHRVS